MRSLDIVIVSFNGRDDLAACLRSLHDAPPSIPHAMVVVDNASSDGSAEMVRADFPAVTVSRTTRTWVRSCQQPWHPHRPGDLVLLLNSDTIVPAARSMASRLRSRHVPRRRRPVPTRRRSGRCRVVVRPDDQSLERAAPRRSSRGCTSAASGRAPPRERITRTRQVVDWVTGACLLVRRADAEASASSTSVTSCTRRTSTSVPPSGPAVASGALRARDRGDSTMRGRSRPPRARRGRAYRRSQLAFYAKHHPGWAPLVRMYLG